MLRRELLKSAVATAVAGGLIQKVVASEVATHPVSIDASQLQFEWSNELPSPDTMKMFGVNAISKHKFRRESFVYRNKMVAHGMPFMLTAKQSGKIVGWTAIMWAHATVCDSPLITVNSMAVRFRAMAYFFVNTDNKDVASAMMDEAVIKAYEHIGSDRVKSPFVMTVVEKFWDDKHVPEQTVTAQWLARNTASKFKDKPLMESVDYELLPNPIASPAERIEVFEAMSRKIILERGRYDSVGGVKQC